MRPNLNVCPGKQKVMKGSVLRKKKVNTCIAAAKCVRICLVRYSKPSDQTCCFEVSRFSITKIW